MNVFMSDIKRVRVKICGLTNRQDVNAAVRAGADAIGFVFYQPSPRAVTAEQAASLVKFAAAFVQVVGLFVNASVDEIKNVLSTVSLDLLQLHGDESPAECRQIGLQTGRRWIKALAVKPDMNIAEQIDAYVQAGASAILLDAWHPQLKGGTGQTFDWTKWPKTNVPLILAGGLNPANVAGAIMQTNPYAVDVSGGVEASKGIKNHQLIEKFIQGVQRG